MIFLDGRGVFGNETCLKGDGQVRAASLQIFTEHRGPGLRAGKGRGAPPGQAWRGLGATGKRGLGLTGRSYPSLSFPPLVQFLRLLCIFPSPVPAALSSCNV